MEVGRQGKQEGRTAGKQSRKKTEKQIDTEAESHGSREVGHVPTTSSVQRCSKSLHRVNPGSQEVARTKLSKFKSQYVFVRAYEELAKEGLSRDSNPANDSMPANRAHTLAEEAGAHAVTEKGGCRCHYSERRKRKHINQCSNRTHTGH